MLARPCSEGICRGTSESIFGHDFRQGSKVNTGLHSRKVTTWISLVDTTGLNFGTLLFASRRSHMCKADDVSSVCLFQL